MLAMMLVLGLTRSRAGRDMPRLLLAGVCVAYLCAAGILLITYLADATVTNEIVMWLMGSLAMHRPAAAGEIALVLVPLAVYAGISARGMDLLTLGDELAASRGVAVGRLTYVLFIGTGILVAIIVANCGPIGFVGLMVPHILRSLVGERSLPLLIAALFGGAAFLAACDGLARVLARSGELPVGVLTNMLGAVFFFALLFRRGRLVIPR
jgi:iron complex transport system permease protein